VSDYILCASPLDSGGFCRRRLRPGERCPDHNTLAPPDGSEPGPLAAEPCYCSRPISFQDDHEVRCVRCGHTVEPPEPKKSSKPPDSPPVDTGPLFPEQMSLDL
jgi:hypothetical protein